ncbi:MAG: FtsX-like permease family protein, partial [Gammaproteobacteria bacterium]
EGQGIGGYDQDDAIIIPITTARQRISGRKFTSSVDFIIVAVENRSQLHASKKEIVQLLRERHRIRDSREDDFIIDDASTFVDMAQMVAKVLSVLLAVIASISLLVGSIGIMNMMLVSVSERTREIGLRKAIGAPQSNIMLQILLETILIALLGSLIGMLAGIGISQLTGMILGWVVPVSLWSIVLAFMVALVVGVSAGFFPAMKAAKMDPIKALSTIN